MKQGSQNEEESQNERETLEKSIIDLEKKYEAYKTYISKFHLRYKRAPLFIEMPEQMIKQMNKLEFNPFKITHHSQILKALGFMLLKENLDWSGVEGLAYAKELIQKDFEIDNDEFPSMALLPLLSQMHDYIKIHDPVWEAASVLSFSDLIFKVSFDIEMVDKVLIKMGLEYDGEEGLNNAVNAINQGYLKDRSECPAIEDIHNFQEIYLRIKTGEWIAYGVKSLYDLYKRTIVLPSLRESYFVTYFFTSDNLNFIEINEINYQLELLLDLIKDFREVHKRDPREDEIPHRFLQLIATGKFKPYNVFTFDDLLLGNEMNLGE